MKRTIVLLVICILACAVANLIVAINATKADPLRSAGGASARGKPSDWPAATPVRWPLPTTMDTAQAFAAKGFDARAVDGVQTTHVMELTEFGWPFPVLQRVQLWWPWDDPQWSTTVSPDSGLTFRWIGLALNPLLGGLAFWALLAAPLHLFPWSRQRRRAARKLCIGCGHPHMGASNCPECGLRV